MAKKEDNDETKGPGNPHHILTEVESHKVGRLQVRKPGGPTIQSYSPASTLPELHAQISEVYGAGVYEVTGLDVNGRRLPSWARLDIEESNRPGLIVRNQSEFDETKMADRLTDTATVMLREQMSRVAEEQEAIRREKAELAADRFAQEQKIMEAREKASSDNVSMIMGFLEKQQEAERGLRKEQDRLRREAEQQEKERERKAGEARQKFELERQREMAKLEQARAEIEQQRIEAMSEDADRKLQDERRFSEMKIEQILSQTKQETELAKRMMELEVQQRKRELEQQYGFVGDDSVPKSILEELWQRRLDKEYPEEGDLDRIMRKYVEPVMAMFQNSNISLPGLPPGGTVQPEGGSLLQGPPNAQGIPEGVDLDEYEEGEAVGFDDIGDVGFGGESESEGEYIEELDDAPFQLPRGNMG